MDWVPRALERKIELGFEAPNTVVKVSGDDVLLRELLGNLLDNAISYGKSGGHISVSIESTPHFKLIVEDDGPGIPLSEHDKIFERFYRVPGSQGDGCGLGLAIVKEIADLHNVFISINSRFKADYGTRIEMVFNDHN
jgi:two-component system sensor histidine kinase TctE